MNRRKFLTILGLGAATTPLAALRPATAPTPAVDIRFHGPVLGDQDVVRRLEEGRQDATRRGGVVSGMGRMVWTHAGETIIPMKRPTVESLKRGNPRKPR